MQTRHARRDPAAFLAARVVEMAPSPTIGVSDRARQLKSQGIDVRAVEHRLSQITARRLQR